MVLILIVGLILVIGSFGTIGAGERGVKLRFGAVVGHPIGEGLYFKIPLIESVITMNVKTEKEQVEAYAASKDLQTVHSVVALNYHVNPDQVSVLYRSVGVEYKTKLIDPILQESVKSAVAHYTAEELITKREDVREKVKLLLVDKLAVNGIVVDDFNIVNFNFSESFNKAIEAKVTAEQSALAAKNKLEQVKFEAEQKVAEAKGKAEAIKIEAEALQSNRQILEFRIIEKWNGVLPVVTGTVTPMIDVSSLAPVGKK